MAQASIGLPSSSRPPAVTDTTRAWRQPDLNAARPTDWPSSRMSTASGEFGRTVRSPLLFRPHHPTAAVARTSSPASSSTPVQGACRDRTDAKISAAETGSPRRSRAATTPNQASRRSCRRAISLNRRSALRSSRPIQAAARDSFICASAGTRRVARSNQRKAVGRSPAVSAACPLAAAARASKTGSGSARNARSAMDQAPTTWFKDSGGAGGSAARSPLAS
jgi:hypothetical protein